MADLSLLASEIGALLRDSSRDDAALRVCTACAATLPCAGSVMTVMSSDVGRETVYASDAVIDDFETAQYTLGSGPSLQAFTSRRPVLIPDLSEWSVAIRWPGLADVVTGLPVGAVFCFPMLFGAISVGVCTLYRPSPSQLDDADVSFILDALDLTTLALLEVREGSLPESLLDRWLTVDGDDRRQVHQATGMLIGQLGVNAEHAFARLRAHAFSDGRDIEQIADDIVNRRLRLEPDAV